MRAIYYDTETTGVRPGTDRVIELAAYDPLNDKSFCTLIDPEVAIPAESTAICHITDQMVQGAPKFKEAWSQFLLFASGDVVLIAHNNDAFDKLFLESETSRTGAVLPPFAYIDSLKWARKYRNDLPRHSLQHLREVYGIQANQAHRALDDVMVLYRVFSAMVGDLSINKILELLAKPVHLSRMPFGKHAGKPLAEIPKDYVLWLKTSGAFEKKENEPLKEAFEKLGIAL
jgi:DNA polymerase-3 subunit epsilon